MRKALGIFLAFALCLSEIGSLPGFALAPQSPWARTPKASARDRAIRFAQRQIQGKVNLEDILAFQSIFEDLEAFAGHEHVSAIAGVVKAINDRLGKKSPLHLNAQSLRVENLTTGESTLTLILEKNGRPWRSIYLNWQKLSPAGRLEIGIGEAEEHNLQREETSRVAVTQLAGTGMVVRKSK